MERNNINKGKGRGNTHRGKKEMEHTNTHRGKGRGGKHTKWKGRLSKHTEGKDSEHTHSMRGSAHMGKTRDNTLREGAHKQIETYAHMETESEHTNCGIRRGSKHTYGKGEGAPTQAKGEGTHKNRERMHTNTQRGKRK